MGRTDARLIKSTDTKKNLFCKGLKLIFRPRFSQNKLSKSVFCLACDPAHVLAEAHNAERIWLELMDALKDKKQHRK
jgi:hypothetical protein